MNRAGCEKIDDKDSVGRHGTHLHWGDRSMKIENANIFRNGKFAFGNLVFDRTIQAEESKDSVEQEETLDAEGGYLIPGLIDVHTHAAVGADASDGDSAGIARMAGHFAKNGVTAFCPTTMTLPEEMLKKAIRSIRDCALPEGSARIAGIHLEGPFVSREKCGAQNPDYIALPDPDMFKRLQDAAEGTIRLITIAPEAEGAEQFIRAVSGMCTVSLGHTTADYDTAMRAFVAGASHVTHLFNAMPSLQHRAPGVIAAASDAMATVELIPDGLHVHPAVVRLTHRLFGQKLVLISDSLRCAGMPDGTYEFGGQLITLRDKKATLEGTDTLAGSCIHLMEGLRRAVSFGIPLEAAVTAATETPAKAIGVFDRIGSIEQGKEADLVLLDDALQVKAVFVGGRKVVS